MQVRLGLTGMDFIITRVMQNELISNNPECRDLVLEAVKYLQNITSKRPSGSHLSSTSNRPRLPNAVMLAIGGWSGGGPTNGVEAYDIRADHWINVTVAQERPHAYHGTALLDGSVYCVGGFDRAEQLNSVRRFDLSAHTWHEVSPMIDRRCYVSVTALDGYIYAMGGYDGYARLCTAERFWPEANQWSPIAPMQEHRSDASSATLHSAVGE